jgi:hypothetical protein
MMRFFLKPKKIIFLDIDGVLNFQSHYESKEFNEQVKKDMTDNLEAFKSEINPEAVERINRLCKETGAEVVLSSSWRRNMSIDGIQKIMNYCGATFKIIDRTPLIGTARGFEIEEWLSNKGFSHIHWSIEEQRQVMDRSGIDNYVIIDDDNDMLYRQRNHFVHILPPPRHLHGFDEAHFNKALAILKENVVTLEYGRPDALSTP